MKKALLLLTLAYSFTAHSQSDSIITNKKLYKSALVSTKDSLPLGLKTFGVAVYAFPEINNSVPTFNQIKWVVRYTENPSIFEVNGDSKEPVIFKIGETEYLILNKKIYKLLNK